MLIDFVCYMQFQGRTINLEHLCGKTTPIQTVNTQLNVRSEAATSLLKAYSELAEYEDEPVRMLMLETLRNSSQRILFDAQQVCLARPYFREIAYNTRLNHYRQVPGINGRFLVVHNRVVYILALQYLC